LNIEGSKYVTTSDKFLEHSKDKLPEEIVFIGGGYISFEFAHVAALAGSKVTILHRGEQSLEHFDSDLVGMIIEKSKSMGIGIHLRTTVKKIEKIKSQSSITVSSKSPMGKDNSNGNNKILIYTSSISDEIDNKQTNLDQMTFQADMVVHGAGRIPNIHELDLAKAGVESSPKGIKVNDYLQSVSNPYVYAAGDVVDSGGMPLTPVASYDGNIVSNNLLNGNIDKTNYSGLPSVVFTIPAIASVGLNEIQAKERGLRYEVNYPDTSGWYSSKRVGESC
jgi:glutathione reductase (NADPH)